MKKAIIDDQDELFVVVDKDDHIIGYKVRRDCHSNKNLIHRAIHILIVNDKEEILLQKRSMVKDLQPGMYTLSVGGHVAKGESYLSCAKRELLEELGIKIPITELTKYLAEVSDQSEYVTVYKGKSNGPFKIDTREVEKIEFVKKSQLSELRSLITPISILTLKRLNLI